jgi:fructokinase
MSGHSRLFGAVEAGGSKFACAIADASGTIRAESRFATAEPLSTLALVRDFFLESSRSIGAFAAIGVASFGPIVLDAAAPNYGFISKTPKAGWSNTDIVGGLSRQFACPIGFDTDVNAAALAECRWGAGRDLQDLVYLTIGTGIGGGVLVNGVPIHGLLHPEIGHMHPRRHVRDAGFAGVCPFHGDCFEGMASGPAILARSGAQLQNLDAAHIQWELQADYLGQLCAQLVMTLSPQRIIIGGGVMTQQRLLPLIRQRMLHWLGGYIERREILVEIDQYVVAPALAPRSGLLGAVILAMNAATVAHSSAI